MDRIFSYRPRNFRIPVLAACMAALSLGPAEAEPPKTLAGWTAPAESSLGPLVKRLDDWLDGASAYPARRPAPEITFVSPQDAELLRGQATARHLDGRLRGLYDPETTTIFLVAPWSLDNPRDLGTLLHELVHHRQETARHWYCDAAQEEDAYRLQERWLKTRGVDPDFYWPAIILSSSCTPRDIHPQ